MQNKVKNILSRVIKFCPKSGRPVKALNKWMIPIFGLLSIVWILIRVIPKPQRATYPCMKVAFPFASAVVIYIASLATSVVIYRNAFRKVSQSRYFLASLLFILAVGVSVISLTVNSADVFAGTAPEDAEYEDPLGPNAPIGDAKGILPGRVVWIHNPDATNENCTPWNIGDGYFLDKNADQDVVNEMLKKAILEVTGSESEDEAWSLIFNYFNSTHNKGEVGYKNGEKIFIKINAVHAWKTSESLGILFDDAYGNVDTSPQVILAVLRQLINKGGVPQEAIYIGDPYTNIFKHLHDKLYDEFPNVNYLSKGDYDGRYKLKHTNSEQIKFSDRGTVLDVETDSFYDCIIDADYVLNIPALKGHRGGGITFFAKNHFGSNTQDGASHMHKGLHKGNSDPLRGDYNMYRVMVDLMAYEHLGGKTLIYIGDFLWGTSMEHDPPVKFLSAPFNDDWSSSLLVSMDPVAISSVGLDILQEEFQVEDLDVYPPRNNYVHFNAVDDYLHQAASSEWWPEGMVYDPEDDGTPISSLGVHEHWNNATDRQYTRNLGTGDGIELVYLNTQHDNSTSTKVLEDDLGVKCYFSNRNSALYLTFDFESKDQVDVQVYNLSGRQISDVRLESIQANSLYTLPIGNITSGYYVVKVKSGDVNISRSIIVK